MCFDNLKLTFDLTRRLNEIPLTAIAAHLSILFRDENVLGTTPESGFVKTSETARRAKVIGIVKQKCLEVILKQMLKNYRNDKWDRVCFQIKNGKKEKIARHKNEMFGYSRIKLMCQILAGIIELDDSETALHEMVFEQCKKIFVLELEARANMRFGNEMSGHFKWDNCGAEQDHKNLNKNPFGGDQVKAIKPADYYKNLRDNIELKKKENVRNSMFNL